MLIKSNRLAPTGIRLRRNVVCKILVSQKHYDTYKTKHNAELTSVMYCLVRASLMSNECVVYLEEINIRVIEVSRRGGALRGVRRQLGPRVRPPRRSLRPRVFTRLVLILLEKYTISTYLSRHRQRWNTVNDQLNYLLHTRFAELRNIMIQ